MPVTAHTAYIGPAYVLPSGTVKAKDRMTIADMLQATQEMRVVPDATIPNSANYPTIEQYITLEAAAGFKVKAINGTIIVTDNG